MTLVPGAVALLFGVLGLAGMYFGIAAFRSIAPGYQTMAFSTALLLILFGGILAAGALRPFGQGARTAIQGAMIAVALIGIIELPFNIFGSHFFIESQLVGMGNAIAGKPTSPISPATIILVLLTAIGFFLLVPRFVPAGNFRTRDPAGLLGLAVALGGFTIVLSYLYGMPLIYGSGLIPVAAPTAIAFLAVGTGLVTAAGTDAAPLRFISGDSIRALLLRTFLPLTIAVILAVIAFEIVRHIFGGTFDAILTAVSIVVFCLIMGAVVIRVSGQVSDTLEAARREQKKAEEALQKAHDVLEVRVRQRTAELEVKNEELGALNEELTATQEELQGNIAELGERERDLSRALAEKEVLLSEIHHRVKNNLTAFISLLSLEGSIEDTPAGKTLRQDLQNRARSMSLIHETLYRTKLYNEVDMGLYLTTLLDYIGNSFWATGNPVKTVVDAHGVMLDISRATAAGLIVNELVTNSYKYAFSKSLVSGEVRTGPPAISVVIAKNDAEYQMTVKDNGPGLPKGFDITTTHTLGLKLVNFLARHQMRAKIEVNTDNGTEFIFRFGE